MPYRDVMKLKEGDRIKISPGRYETVTRRTKRDKKFPNVVTIFTSESTIVTYLPATVDVVNE